MKTSEQVDEIYAALASAQSEMQSAIKSSTNSFFKGSKYATFEDVKEACRIPLAKYNLGVVQAPEFEDGRLVLTTRIIHKSGQWMESSLSMRPKEDSPQAIGSTITYARRYALSAMLCISSDDDDDGNAASGKSHYSKNDFDDDQLKKLIKAEAQTRGMDINQNVDKLRSIVIDVQLLKPTQENARELISKAFDARNK